MAAASIACGREGAGGPAPLRVAVDTSEGSSHARVVVTGVDAANLRALRSQDWSAEPPTKLVQVSVAGTGGVQIAGRYAVSDTAIEFRPAFPFDAGRAYAVRVDPGNLSEVAKLAQLPLGTPVVIHP